MAVVPITMALSLFEANANSIPEERAIQQMFGAIAGHLGGGPPDCSDLPESMQKKLAATVEKGCPGAVWADGSPSEEYCTSSGYGSGKYPWWKHCCKWQNGQCVKKTWSK